MMTYTLRSIGILALAIVVLAGCDGFLDGDYRPRATGQESEIMVVVDSVHWDTGLGQSIRDNLAPYVETLPAPEREFDLRQVHLDSDRVFDMVQGHKNVVFIAPLSDQSNLANFLRNRLSDDALETVRDGNPAIVSRPDLWRRSQKIYYMTAADTEQLIDALERHGERVRSDFHEITLERMERDMFRRARQFDLEDTLMARHDFAVNVQHDYQIAIDTTTGNTGFMWLRRVLADSRRELMIHYVDGMSTSEMTPEWIYERRDSLNEKYIRGNLGSFVRTDYRRPLNTHEVDHLGRYGYQTRGLWHMVYRADEDAETLQERGAGGPFVNYTFYDQDTDRVYMIDGHVFAPEHDKRDFLRQMEVIAHTFRTRVEAEGASDDEDEATLAADD